MKIKKSDIIEYLKYFHRYFTLDININTENEILSFVNLVIPADKISIAELQKDNLVNENVSNIVFTPINDFENIFSFEPYKDILYIRMDKYYPKICMHLLPNSFDAVKNNLLLWKDSDINLDDINLSKTKQYKNEDLCTVYKQDQIENSFGEYNISLPKSIKEMTNLEINANYKYNTTSKNINHSIGLRDTTNYATEDRRTLFFHEEDALNHNENIAQLNEKLAVDNPITELAGFKIPNHKQNILYHSKLKYISDDLYIEQQNNSAYADWIDNAGGS